MRSLIAEKSLSHCELGSSQCSAESGHFAARIFCEGPEVDGLAIVYIYE